MLRRSRPALLSGLLPALALTDCVSVAVGWPGAVSSSGRTDRAGDAEVTIVGATDDPVDELAQDALADLEDYWAQQLPDIFRRPFQPLQGGYFSADPNDVDPDGDAPMTCQAAEGAVSRRR